MHNKYYRANPIHIDVNALDQLPQDGSLSQFTAIAVESPVTDNPATNTTATDIRHANSHDETSDPYNAHLPQSFVPIATWTVTEQEAVRQSVQPWIIERKERDR